jgi:hypothetical protein
MGINFDSGKIPSRQEREERVLDLYFNQNKNYRQIAKEMKMSVRDIGEIVNRAKQEKTRQGHKTLTVQAYELFYKGKTPLEVAIILNIGQAQATAYYAEYLKLVQLDDITQIYRDLGSSVWDFVKLCKEAKAAKIGSSQVVNLLKIANNQLPSVESRYKQLQTYNNQLESILKTKSNELQDINSLKADAIKNLDSIKLEYRREMALLKGLQQQREKLEAFTYNYKNNDEDYIKVRKSIENKIHDSLSDKKPFLKLAIFSLINSMRNNPDKYTSLIYHNNENQSKDDFNPPETKWSGNVIFTTPPPYDEYIIEDCKSVVLEEAEKLYNILTDQLLCDVINENVAKQSAENMPSSLPALPLEEKRGEVEYDKEN